MCIKKNMYTIILYIFKNKFKIIKTQFYWNLVKFFIYHYYKTMDKNTQMLLIGAAIVIVVIVVLYLYVRPLYARPSYIYSILRFKW
jgi:flagellar biosynthesis/type III secretory pathway M-ring protein FliF/YscJ